MARGLGVPARALSGAHAADRAAYDDVLAAAIGDCSPSLIVLAGFMRILSAQFVARFAGRILNIHPSLLPKFPGLHTHRRALQAHEPEHGATVHFVTEQLDGGPPMIQARIAVNRKRRRGEPGGAGANPGTPHLPARRPLVLRGPAAIRGRPRVAGRP